MLTKQPPCSTTGQEKTKGEDTPMTVQLLAHVAQSSLATLRTTKGIAQGTMVLTADGSMPIEHLTPGDRIITRGGLRVLVDVAVEIAVGEVVRICANTQGHARPNKDVILGCDQGLMIRDWRANAMHGAEQAAVAVERMVDGEMIRYEKVSGLRLYTLEFASPAVVYAGELEVACEGAPAVARPQSPAVGFA